MDTNWKKVPVDPTDEMLRFCWGHAEGLKRQVWQAMLSAAPEYKPSHSLEEDFQHFLAYQNWLGLSDEDIARLRIAYEHGVSRGE